eukprot:SAG22_NODE_20509_length_265_cov_0.620482_1_plen_62_part_10
MRSCCPQMFANTFQGGPSVEVFTAVGSNPTANWKVSPKGKPKKVYDKESKGHIFELEASNAK